MKNISIELVEDLFTTAVEGGIDEWATIGTVNPDNCSAFVTFIGPDNEYLVRDQITWGTFIRGIDRLAVRVDAALAGHYQDLIEGNWDAVTADVIVQLGLFDEIIFG